MFLMFFGKFPFKIVLKLILCCILHSIVYKLNCIKVK